MDLSVLIPTRNRRELLARTLPTVLRQDFPASRYEVIVAVDGSEDDTAAFLRDLIAPCALRVLGLPHRGRPAALNAALAAAHGAVVLFLDDDLLCPPSLLRRHWEGYRPDRAVLGPVLLAEESGDGIAAAFRGQALLAGWTRLAQVQEPGPLSMGHANSSACRQRLLAVNGFDESFLGSCEEEDCGFRLWQAGVRFTVLAQAIAREIYVKKPAELVHHATGHGRNEWRLCEKHGAYRPYSRLQQARLGSCVKRWLRRAAVQSPLNPDCLLAPVTWAAERFPVLRGAGVRVLGARIGMAFFRGAARQAGSWQALMAALNAGSTAIQEFSYTVPQLH